MSAIIKALRSAARRVLINGGWPTNCWTSSGPAFFATASRELHVIGGIAFFTGIAMNYDARVGVEGQMLSDTPEGRSHVNRRVDLCILSQRRRVLLEPQNRTLTSLVDAGFPGEVDI